MSTPLPYPLRNRNTKHKVALTFSSVRRRFYVHNGKTIPPHELHLCFFPFFCQINFITCPKFIPIHAVWFISIPTHTLANTHLPSSSPLVQFIYGLKGSIKRWPSVTSAIMRRLRACVRARVCVRLCVVLLRPWPDVCGVFTHVSWHVLTCLRCVIVCVIVLERSDPVDRWKKNHPPVLPFSVCLSVHYYPSFLFLSQSPLSLSFSFLSLSLPFLSLSLYFLSLSPSLHYHCSTIRPARDRECSCLGVLQRGWGGEWRGGCCF